MCDSGIRKGHWQKTTKIRIKSILWFIVPVQISRFCAMVMYDVNIKISWVEDVEQLFILFLQLSYKSKMSSKWKS